MKYRSDAIWMNDLDIKTCRALLRYYHCWIIYFVFKRPSSSSWRWLRSICVGC